RARGGGRARRRRPAAHAARHARGAGGRDRALRRGAARRPRRPGRALRRTFHDQPRGEDGRRGPRGCARRRASPFDVSRVVRGALVGVCAVLLAAVVAGCGGSGEAARPTTTVRQLRQFRVVFPEGFTRVQMAARTGVVAEIATREGHRKVKLSQKAYLAATGHKRSIPGFGAKKLPLEGFLFPDTYDFDRTSTSAQLVQAQLDEFASKWSTLDLEYARSKN